MLYVGTNTYVIVVRTAKSSWFRVSVLGVYFRRNRKKKK